MNKNINRMDPAHGEVIIPHLKMNEEIYIEDEEGFERKYRIEKSKQLDGRTFRHYAIIKPI